MKNELANPVDLSAEAILELEELKQHVRSDAPMFEALLNFLRTPVPAFQGKGISMLDDIRSYTLLRDSVNPESRKAKDLAEFSKVLRRYFEEAETGVKAGNKTWIDEAKRFCLAFNANLLAKQMNEIYGRRERSDSRYINHESLS